MAALEKDYIEKIEIRVDAKLFGFRRYNETVEEAKARITFEAEQRVNLIGDIRAHMEVKG